MSKRAFRIATVTSTVLFIGSVVLFLAGFILNPWDHYLSFNDESHVGVLGMGFESKLVFFNDTEYGPYRGSIIGLVDEDMVEDTNGPSLRDYALAFAQSVGVYYRYFEFPDDKLWTLMVNLWYPIVIFSILPIINAMGWIRTRRNSKTA